MVFFRVTRTPPPGGSAKKNLVKWRRRCRKIFWLFSIFQQLLPSLRSPHRRVLFCISFCSHPKCQLDGMALVGIGSKWVQKIDSANNPPPKISNYEEKKYRCTALFCSFWTIFAPERKKDRLGGVGGAQFWGPKIIKVHIFDAFFAGYRGTTHSV